MSVKQVTITIPQLLNTSDASRRAALERFVNSLTASVPVLVQQGDITRESNGYYSVDYKWGDAENILINAFVETGAYIGLRPKYKTTSGKWETISYAEADVRSESAVCQIVMSEDNFLFAEFNGSNLSERQVIPFLKIKDRITGKQYLAFQGGLKGKVTDTMNGLSFVSQSLVLRNLGLDNAISEQGVSGTFAVPIIWYSNIEQVFSGGPGGFDLLYRIYENTSKKTFTDTFTKFSVDGHNFMNLSADICIRLD